MRALLFSAVLSLFLSLSVQADTPKVGEKFDLAHLTGEKAISDISIVAFVPSLTSDCAYASMLTQSFYYYFDQHLAFEGLSKDPPTRIFLVVADKQNAAKSTQNIIGGMSVIYDETGEIFRHFGIKTPSGKNADSTAILLDSKQTVALIDEHYRSQGEHLKPLENKLKELNGIYNGVRIASPGSSLKIGEMAPEFRVNRDKMLSDLRGRVVLVSFYPAAFSGTLPSPSALTPGKLNAISPMSCILQIETLDRPSLVQKDVAKKIVISSSTDSLLTKWREVLGAESLEFTNDPDYSISSRYFSYNPAGYNNRVSVIIDQKGRIAYIDDNFEPGDGQILEAKVAELITNKSKF